MKMSALSLALSVSFVSACTTPVEGTESQTESSSAGAGDSGDEPTSSTTDGSPTTGESPTTDNSTSTTTTTSDGGESETTTDATQPAMCGNGIIEGDEACDDGLMANGPGQACSWTCEVAACGDGDLQVSNAEACDHGALNVAQPGYEQCSTTCERGGYCGDGIVQPEGGEQCEPTPKPGDVDNCAAMCRHKPRFIFLTSTIYTGDLDGIAGADKACNELAAASPDLTGTYRAWLLVDGQVLADRFPEFTEPVAWNFTNLGANVLATSFQELVALGPADPIAYTELGASLPEARVWTNITGTGTAAGGDCSQWTSTAGTALIGHAGFVPNKGPMAVEWHEGRWWTDFVTFKPTCAKSHHLYCIQVAD